MFKVIQFTNEENYIDDFISIPSTLYDKNMGHFKDEEYKLLTNTHILSDQFDLYKFLVYENDKPVARALITLYKEETIGYLGYYECIDNIKCSSTLFNEIEKFAKSLNIKELIGPVNCSFYINYRMKIDGYDKPYYLNEPYNKEYYYNQFVTNNYDVIHRYTSYYLQKMGNNARIKQMIDRRYDKCIQKGYVFKTLKDVKYEETMSEVYKVFTETYRFLPVYKDVTLEQFQNLFSKLKYILNPKYVILIYYNEELIGFSIIIPDYSNLLFNKLTPKSIIKILKTRFFTNDHLAYYFAVKPGHYIVSQANLKNIYDNIKKNTTVLATLVKSNADTINHFKDSQEPHSNYVLLSKRLSDN